jgi:hypothetical protein
MPTGGYSTPNGSADDDDAGRHAAETEEPRRSA